MVEPDEKSLFGSPAIIILLIIAGLVAIYLLGFGFILIDALLWNDAVYHRLPGWLKDFVETLYSPLIYLARLLVN